MITMYKNYTNFGNSFCQERIIGKIQDMVSFNIKMKDTEYLIYQNQNNSYIVKYLYDGKDYNLAYLHDLLKGDFGKELYMLLPLKNGFRTVKCTNVHWEMY